jgi:glycosyltransferase involved in cell wall biosynthesis
MAGRDAIIIGTIGRLQPVKDQVTLAQAFVQMLTVRPDLRSRLRLVIVGDGPLRAPLETLIENAGVTNLVWMPGFRDDIADVYRVLRIFVLPSRREGTSYTALEAMATGLPVVATQVGGNPEIVEDGVTGLLTPAGDPKTLAKRILRYVDDPNLSAAHGRVGRVRAMRQFSLSRMTEAYGDVYRSITPATKSHNGNQK